MTNDIRPPRRTLAVVALTLALSLGAPGAHAAASAPGAPSTTAEAVNAAALDPASAMAIDLIGPVAHTGPARVGDLLHYEVRATNLLPEHHAIEPVSTNLTGRCTWFWVAPQETKTDCVEILTHRVSVADAMAGEFVPHITFQMLAGTYGTPPIAAVTTTGASVPVAPLADDETDIFRVSMTGPVEDVQRPLTVGDRLSYVITATNMSELTRAVRPYGSNLAQVDTCRWMALAPGQTAVCTAIAHHVLTEDDLRAGSFTPEATYQAYAGIGYRTPVVDALHVDGATTHFPVLTLSAGALTLVGPAAEAYEPGDALLFTFPVTNVGIAPALPVATSGTLQLSCGTTAVAVGETRTCEASTVLSEADVAAGRFDPGVTFDAVIAGAPEHEVTVTATPLRLFEVIVPHLTSHGVGVTPHLIRIGISRTSSAELTDVGSPDEGTYTWDPVTRYVTFTPTLGFSGVAQPATYRVTDAYGRQASATITPHVAAPAGPRPIDLTSSGAPGRAQSTGNLLLPAGGRLELVGAYATRLTVPEGTYQLVDGQPALQFTPVHGFVGPASPARYRVIDAYEQAGTAEYQATVVASAPRDTPDGDRPEPEASPTEDPAQPRPVPSDPAPRTDGEPGPPAADPVDRPVTDAPADEDRAAPVEDADVPVAVEPPPAAAPAESTAVPELPGASDVAATEDSAASSTPAWLAPFAWVAAAVLALTVGMFLFLVLRRRRADDDEA